MQQADRTEKKKEKSHCSVIDISSRLKISKDIENMNNAKLTTDIYGHSSQTIAENILLNWYGIFTKVNQILGHKIKHDKFKRIEITQNMLSDDTWSN